MKLKNALLVTALAAASGYAVMAAAVTTTSNSFQATITIENSCDVSTGISDMDFGTANFLTIGPIDRQTNITVKCTQDASYNVGLSGAGTMSDGTHTIPYLMYRDSGHSNAWGNTISIDTMSGTGDGTDQTLTVYGRVASIPASAPAGDYSDTVTVNVTY